MHRRNLSMGMIVLAVIRLNRKQQLTHQCDQPRYFPPRETFGKQLAVGALHVRHCLSLPKTQFPFGTTVARRPLGSKIFVSCALCLVTDFFWSPCFMLGQEGCHYKARYFCCNYPPRRCRRF